jgi:hypothetical protein
LSVQNATSLLRLGHLVCAEPQIFVAAQNAIKLNAICHGKIVSGLMSINPAAPTLVGLGRLAYVEVDTVVSTSEVLAIPLTA